MNTRAIEFQVRGQILCVDNPPSVVADSRNFLTAVFTFDQTWDGLPKTALFTGLQGTSYTMLLNQDRCLVPHEIIKSPRFSVSVVGGDLITTNRVEVEVQASGYVQGVTPPPPTPDIFTQLVNTVSTERQSAQAAATAAAGSQSLASEAATSASASANTSSLRAADAGNSAGVAAAKAVDAGNAATSSASKAAEAASFAVNAKTSESAATQSAAESLASSAAAKASENAAKAAETNAAASATSAANTALQISKLADTFADAYIKTTPTVKAYAVIDSANSKLRALTVSGETTQAGTPTPSAPIPLVSISGANVNVLGKNLYNIGSSVNQKFSWMTTSYGTISVTNGELTSSYNNYSNGSLGQIVSVIPTSKLVFSAACKALSNVGDSFVLKIYGQNSGQVLANVMSSSIGSTLVATCTVPSDVTQVCCVAFVHSSTTDGTRTATFTNIQLELGSTATVYEPYKSPQAVVLNASTTGISWFTLRGISVVGDTVEVDTNTGAVKLVQQIKLDTTTKGVIDVFAEKSNADYTLFYAKGVTGRKGGNTPVLCTHFVNTDQVMTQTYNAEGMWINTSPLYPNTVYIRLANSRLDMTSNATKISSANTFLATLDCHYLYQLATPIITDITSSTAGQVLLAMHSHYPSTTTTCETPVSMTYKTDTTNVLNNIVNAIIKLGGTI